jgi:SAM-dependent methyltransferase
MYIWVMPNNYDPIAAYYDLVHRLFYGRAEINAQVELLSFIKPGDRLLIVGGGTGWILEKIAALYRSGLAITYIESSSAMMALSRKRDYGQNRVEFVEGSVGEGEGSLGAGKGPVEAGKGLVEAGKGPVEAGKGLVEEFSTTMRYDCILTGFFFDNFPSDQAGRIVGELAPRLGGGGFWLFADFHYQKGKGKWWQAVLLKLMYVSARLIVKVEGKELTDMEPIFEKWGFEQEHVAFYYGGFIKAIAYRKKGV